MKINMIHEHELEADFKRLREFKAPENSLMRAKNIVMATVRRKEASRLMVPERSSFIQTLIPKYNQYKFKHMPLIAIIIAVVLGGGGTVAAAQNDLPGQALYGVKLASERVAENFAGSGEARLNFEMRLAERRAIEIAELKAKAHAEAAAQPAETADEADEVEEGADVKIEGERANQVERAAAHLEQRVKRMRDRVETLKAKDAEGTLRAATTFEAQLEVWENLLDAVEDVTTKEGLKDAVKEAREEMEEAREHVEEAIEEAQKRHASEVGLEASARGRVAAAENKLAALTKFRTQILERAQREGRFFQKEFEARDKFYQEAVELIEEAKEALAESDWEEAWEKANEAFKVMVQFNSRVVDPRVFRRITPADVQVREVRTGEKVGPPLTPEQIQRIREEAAAGSEAKRQEILKQLEDRHLLEAPVPSPKPAEAVLPDTKPIPFEVAPSVPGVEERKEINVGPFGVPSDLSALGEDAGVIFDGSRTEVAEHAEVSADIEAEAEAVTKIGSVLERPE